MHGETEGDVVGQIISKIRTFLLKAAQNIVRIRGKSKDNGHEDRDELNATMYMTGVALSQAENKPLKMQIGPRDESQTDPRTLFTLGYKKDASGVYTPQYTYGPTGHGKKSGKRAPAMVVNPMFRQKHDPQ